MKDEQLDTDDWREIKKARQEKRHQNMQAGAQILQRHAVTFTAKDVQGIHLVVEHGGKVVDYWPSTGKWIDRSRRMVHRRGVRELLQYVGVTPQL